MNTRYKSSENNVFETILTKFDKDILASLNLFIKVDSTLRGNVMDDIDAVPTVLPDRVIFLAPAFPFYGRTCLEGIYSVKGKPILNTEFAKDQAFRYKTSSLFDDRQDIHHIDWRTLSKGSEAVVTSIKQSGMTKFTFDTRHQMDLAITPVVQFQ